MNALKAHIRLLESDLPRKTHVRPEPSTKQTKRGVAPEARPVTIGRREFRSLTHASAALGISRQAIKKKLGLT
jgi:hypothetical protein